jgi:hypothetical protein
MAVMLKRDHRLEPLQGQALRVVYEGNLVRVQFRRKTRVAPPARVFRLIVIGSIVTALVWALAQWRM